MDSGLGIKITLIDRYHQSGRGGGRGGGRL